jgi:spore germination protein GerM
MVLQSSRIVYCRHTLFIVTHYKGRENDRADDIWRHSFDISIPLLLRLPDFEHFVLNAKVSNLFLNKIFHVNRRR